MKKYLIVIETTPTGFSAYSPDRSAASFHGRNRSRATSMKPAKIPRLRTILQLMLILFFFPIRSLGCTCQIYGDGSPRAFRHYAKIVFAGEVVEVKQTIESERENGASQYAVRFRVERYWKGPVPAEAVVHTDLHGCGPDFKVGTRYLVYAMGKTLETACTRTRILADADRDLRELGPGKDPKRN